MNLQFRDFTVGYRGIRLCEPYTASLSNHNCVHLDGSNGCGKSTFLKGVLGLRTVETRGCFRVYLPEGHLCKQTRSLLQYLPQDAVIARDLTVGEFLGSTTLSWSNASLPSAFARTLQSGEKWWKKELARWDRCYLNPLEPLGQPICELNESRLRYAELLRLHVRQPAIFLLDEPFEGMGEDLFTLARQWLTGRLAEGAIVIVSDHQKRFLSVDGIRVVTAKIKWLTDEREGGTQWAN